MKNILKDKKGQIGITIAITTAMIIVVGIIFLIAVIAGGLLISTILSHLLLILGILVFIFGSLIVVRSDKQNKIVSFVIVTVISAVLIFLQFSNIIPQTTFSGSQYIEAPSFYYYECNAASAPLESLHVTLINGRADGIACPSNTDQCDLYIAQKETSRRFAADRRISYTVCHNNGTYCDPPIATPGNSFFSKNEVPTVHVSNLLTTDRVNVQYQYQTVFGAWYDDKDANVAEWYQTYKPFILWKVDMFGGGKNTYTTPSQGCNFPSGDIMNLLNSVTNSIKQLNTQSSTSNTHLDFYQTRNFIGTYVPISVANVNFVTYNGKQGYCLNRQIFAISTATTNGGTYQIVDSNFNTRLSMSVTCCPGETQPNQKCQQSGDAFSWVPISSATCGAFNACAGADWTENGPKQLIRYNCISSQCVAETKTVECTSNADCAYQQTCAILTHTCQNINPGQVNGTTPTPEVTHADCDKKALDQPLLGWQWTETSSRSCNLWCNLGFTQPTTTTEPQCKPTLLIYYVIGAIVIFIIIMITIVALSKNKYKRISSHPSSHNKLVKR